MKVLFRIYTRLIFTSLLCLYAQRAIAQNASIKISPVNFTSTTVVQSNTSIRLQLERLLSKAEGRLAIFIEQIDVTSQFELRDHELIYKPNQFPLPPGEHTLTVYWVKSTNQWEEIAQFPLKVADSALAPSPPSTTPKEPTLSDLSTDASSVPSSLAASPEISVLLTPGNAKTPPINPSSPTNTPAKASEITRPTVSTSASDLTFTWKPRLSLALASQFSEKRRGEAGESVRPTFTDITYQTGFDAELKLGTFTVQSQFNFLGVTNQEQALRFGQLAQEAPRFDLSDYQINAAWGPIQFSIGHLCYGSHPLLIDGFCSRGMTLKASLSDRLDVSVNRMSATSIVGFDNFTGLNDSDNTITSIVLGYQLLKNDAGGVRLEATYTDGKRKPVGNFDQGQVVDAEESRGIGVRLFGSDRTSRLRFDFGYARSTFTNPPDPQLIEGVEVIPVEPITKNALYADVSYDMFKSIPLGKPRADGTVQSFSLSLNARHERIDPQFQTLGASVNSDQLRNRIGINLELAGAQLFFLQEWTEDNLADIATILKTKTKSTLLNLNLPLQSIFNSQNSFLPSINYSYQRVHQFGANTPVPDESAFDPTEIPDQITTQHQLGVQWNFDTLNLSYQFSSAFQDNRQPSRETADFLNTTHQLALGWQVTPRFLINLGYTWTYAESREEGITQLSQNPLVGLSWQVFPDVTLAMNYGRSLTRDSLDRSLTDATSLEAILTWNFTIRAGSDSQIPGSAFIRYSRQASSSRDNVFDVSSQSTIQVVNAGLSFSF